MNPNTIPHDILGIPRVNADTGTISSILNGVFIVIGATMVLVIVLAAFDYITSGGDASKAKRAKEAILWASLGALVASVAFGTVQFALGRI